MNDKHIKTSFENLTPTTSQKEKVYDNILNNKNDSVENRRPIKLVFAAAIICALTVTTAFAIAGKLDNGFINFLKPSGEQAKYLANGAYEVNKKISNKNGILEIKQVIGDEKLVYILMDFTAPEGTVLDAKRYEFEPIETDFDIKSHNTSYGWGFTKIEDDNPMDNKISLIMSINSEKAVEGQKISLKLVNLQAADELPSEFKTVISGKWKTSFKLNFKNTSHTYTIQKPITIYDEEMTLETVSISPISVNIYMTGKSINSILEKANKNTELFDKVPVTLLFNDDSTYTTTDDNSELFALSHSNYDFTSTKNFNEIINSENVKAIVIFGQKFILE